MMRAARRSSLLVAFSLLTSAATAYADCAWVLWFQQLGGTHLVDSAHPNIEQCDKVLSDYVSVLKQDGYKVSDGVSASHALIVSRGSEKLAYRCLPDTVDPRGSKGK